MRYWDLLALGCEIERNQPHWSYYRLAWLQRAIQANDWAWVSTEWFFSLREEGGGITRRELEAWDDWYYEEILAPEEIAEDWAHLIKEERDVIWQRELIAWSLWLEEKQAAEQATASVRDLKSFLGPARSAVKRFNSEGMIRKTQKPWWQQRADKVWREHVKEHVEQHGRELQWWEEWLAQEKEREERRRYATGAGSWSTPPLVERENTWIDRDGYLEGGHIHVDLHRWTKVEAWPQTKTNRRTGSPTRRR